MLLRFVKDYRSRQWMCRYVAGAVVDVDRAEVVADAISGGCAEPVVSDPVVVETAEPVADSGEDVDA